MLQVLNPTYVFKVTFKDEITGMAAAVAAQNYPASTKLTKFFDSANGKTGCDEVLAAIKDALTKAGLTCDVWLDTFKHS